MTVNGTTWTINRLACTLVSQGSGKEGSPSEAEEEEEVDPRTGKGSIYCSPSILGTRGMIGSTANVPC